MQGTEEMEGYATKCQPAQGEGTVPGPLCTLCMCNLNVESHGELGATSAHTARELGKKVEASSESAKEVRGEGPVLFKHGWISRSVWQRK